MVFLLPTCLRGCLHIATGPTCDFVYTGYRVPLVVISPFTKKHYVSHTVADLTAILKLIETRFNVPALTKRDAAQMDMTEFFDFLTHPGLPRHPRFQRKTLADPATWITCLNGRWYFLRLQISKRNELMRGKLVARRSR